jgi:hypothetical protein
MDQQILELVEHFCGYYICQTLPSTTLSINYDQSLDVASTILSIYSNIQGTTQYIGEFDYDKLIYTHSIVSGSGKLLKREQSGFDSDTDGTIVYLQYLGWYEESCMNGDELNIKKKRTDKDCFIHSRFSKILYSEYFSLRSNLLLA